MQPAERPVSHVGRQLGSSLLLAIVVQMVCCAVSLAQDHIQDNRYVPLDQNAPVGRVGRWSGIIGKGLAGTFQSVQVTVPTSGKVTVYNGGPETGVALGAPAQFSIGVGCVYRLKIAGMPDFPGVELYPTIEIFDRLHPPAGREYEFPVPIAFTEDDIAKAMDGRMVTKVVYLEQPQFAVTGDLTAALLNRQMPPDRNLLIEADRLGRPMILVRLGGRTPDEGHPEEGFFMPPAPLNIEQHVPRNSGADVGRAVLIDKATTFTPSVPRSETDEAIAIRLAQRRGLVRPTRPRAFASLEPALPPWEIYPDEYLLDGGDRDLPVHETPSHREGLDSEDAIAEYVDNTGHAHIVPTNRVAIYSPRFGNVGTATGLESGITVTTLVSAVDNRRGEGLRNRTAVSDHEQRMPLESMRVRSRADGFENQQREAASHQATVLSENFDLAGTIEDVQNLKAPEMRQKLGAKIAKMRQAGIAWTRDEFPIIRASIAGAQQVTVKFVASEIVGVEDRRKPGRIEIVKLADRQTAVPGETVTFRIEYENTGDLPLTEVNIVDNLTPRLDYIAESGKSSRPAVFGSTDNGEGSLILSWKLNEPLPGKSRGWVTFKAHVR
ncbi:MAG TPA: DUF11 domain-containing protein [Planctomycetaceae bacterium]|jgi:uncharacterized repeat protein (TIGR01451 family)|nr:DUF11 domain-containing protein [Planctomycetaceae bacterium]